MEVIESADDTSDRLSTGKGQVPPMREACI